MKIRITDLPQDGLDIKQPLDLEALKQRMSVGRQAEIEFTAPPQVEIKVRPTLGATAEAIGYVDFNYKQACSACMESVPKEVRLKIQFIFRPEPNSAESREEQESTNQLGLVYFKGDSIDLEDAIQEAIILSMSLYWHPPRDKDGKCTVCHKVLKGNYLVVEAENRETTLGKLLKDKGIV